MQAPLPASDGLPGAKMVLYVTDNSALRPVRYELVGGGSTRNEISFSRWGERLNLTAPANAIPASSLTVAVRSSPDPPAAPAREPLSRGPCAARMLRHECTEAVKLGTLS